MGISPNTNGRSTPTQMPNSTGHQGSANLNHSDRHPTPTGCPPPIAQTTPRADQDPKRKRSALPVGTRTKAATPQVKPKGTK